MTTCTWQLAAEVRDWSGTAFIRGLGFGATPPLDTVSVGRGWGTQLSHLVEVVQHPAEQQGVH